jgi:predicted nucleic acid-binding protein
MSARSFLDTNVIVYSDDHDEPAKQGKALDILEETRLSGTGVLSTQVLQEYFVATTTRLGVPARLAREKVEVLSHFEVVVIGIEDVLAAIDFHRLHTLSFWDCLIVRAALASGCTLLFTEDLQHGRRFGSLEVVNPFL